MKRKLSIILAILLSGILIFSLAACGGDDNREAEKRAEERAEERAEKRAEKREEEKEDEEDEEDKDEEDIEEEKEDENTEEKEDEESTETNTEVSTDTEWVIYWYLCGSDLETFYGAATTDLGELLEVELPENVKIIIQTGGTAMWQNEVISADYLERYIYDSNGLELIEQLPLESMGSEDTLSSFLAFGKENYPAKKTGFIFWNHGGGSVAGAAFDEVFGGDSLTLDEMYRAFSANFEMSEENPAFDLIGFDTCLMATVDVAYTFCDIGKFLVASQELEPGNGWYYTDWADALANKPEMDGLELGKIICDTFVVGCELIGTDDDITLSVTNLAKASELISAYNDFGDEALISACDDPAFFAAFSRTAIVSENYGGNTKEDGYTNMVDLGHLARQSADILPETSSNVLTALDNCIEYEVHGPYREEATGLSCYYSYNSDIEDYNAYASLGAGKAFKYYYAYGLTGELSEEGMAYISELNYDSIQPIQTLETQGWDDYPLELDSDGLAVMNLGETAKDILSSVYIWLYYVDIELDMILLLGSDNDLVADWEQGIFKDNFRGVWGAINENLVYMEISFEGDTYNMYSVPILLNGEEYNLSVIYDFETATYEIQGARKEIDENGMADKNLRYLVEGDVITTVYYVMSISGEDDDLLTVEMDEILVDSTLVFDEIELGDGMFMQMFEMSDMQGNTADSDMVMFEIEGDIITTSVGY